MLVKLLESRFGARFGALCEAPLLLSEISCTVSGRIAQECKCLTVKT